VELSVRNGGPSNVQVVDDFLEEPSQPKHMQNWQWIATTSEKTGSRVVMESPYCMACFV
jgi:predicted Zn-ribbon and HTH transcriptional regulator